MHADSKKDRTHIDYILLEQFRRKGYKCEEVEEQDATIFIITHEKKNASMVAQVASETYKSLLKN
jgi:hypothetical protein